MKTIVPPLAIHRAPALVKSQGRQFVFAPRANGFEVEVADTSRLRSANESRSKVVELALGIDLGTSCSKVVIGDPGWKGANYAVPYVGDPGNIAGWLHPTRFGSDKNLKMRLMDSPGNIRLQHLMACCLAEIIRRARDWFAGNGPADYQSCEIHWKVNVGFPGKSLTDSPLYRAYRKIAEIAGALAGQRGAVTLERAQKINTSTGRKRGSTAYSVELYPEIAAQLAGYIHSPFRKGGNVLLVDVGAGTLDVSTLILHENGGEQVVSFQVCDVKDLGVLRLYEERLQSLELKGKKQALRAVSRYQNGCTATPASIGEMLQKPSLEQADAFERVSEDFGERILETILSCAVQFRKLLKDSHAAAGVEPWEEGLRFFLTGGGSRCHFYSERIAGGTLEARLMPV
jgi:hypothetical protein